MSISEGTRLGHYEILGELGAGGMGEVYRASDTKLGRQVALKILPLSFAQEQARMARFEREAQLLASLNHANVAALYGLEESGPALVMELVEGQTLAERIAQGPLPLDEAVPIARQVCDALEAAHAKGIVHRDLKPANIKITPDGQVKVLDFGLAKALEGDETAAAPSATMSPTLTIAATHAGVILGTAAYMSPEQARGIPADKRADIWSFGVVLYEMLTGRMTFGGETVSDTMAAVLRADIDFTLLPADTPQPVRRLLRRCLERDRKQRLRDIGDARLELDSPDEAAPAAAPGPAPRRNWVLWAALAAIPVAAVLGWTFRRPPPPRAPSPYTFTVPAPSGTSDSFGVSPDGRWLAITATPTPDPRSIWVRDLSSGTAREIAGTARGTFAFWSADSRSIAFLAEDKLKRVDIAGGPVQSLCDVSAQSFRGGTWNAGGMILIGMTGSPVLRVPAGGGAPSPVTKLDQGADERAHVYPLFLPDGRRFIYRALAGGKRQYVLASLDGRQPPRPFFEAESQPLYAPGPDGPSGLLLFRRGSALMGIGFDPDAARVAGEEFTIAENTPGTPMGMASAAVSANGRVLVVSEIGAEAGRPELVLLDRSGKRVNTLSAAAPGVPSWGHVEFSPDGSRLLGDRIERGGSIGDLWTYDIRRGIVSRLTSNPSHDGPGVWSADGRRVYYNAIIGDTKGLWSIDADGAGKPELVHKAELHHLHASPDGRFIAYEPSGLNRQARTISVLSLAGGGIETVVQENNLVGHPQFSPDGRWLAFSSGLTGRGEVYVQSHPPGKGRWQVSRDGGSQPRWRRDGREIVFRDSTALQSVAVKPMGDRLEFGAPVKLFEMKTASGHASYFAMSGDAQRFAVNLRLDAGEPSLTVKLDWMPALKR